MTSGGIILILERSIVRLHAIAYDPEYMTVRMELIHLTYHSNQRADMSDCAHLLTLFGNKITSPFMI